MARICKGCGTAANDRATFCNTCGGRLQQGLSSSMPEAQHAAPANPYRSDNDATTRTRESGDLKATGRETGAGASRVPPPAAAATATPPPRRKAGASDLDAMDSAADPSNPADTSTRARQIVRTYSLWSAGLWLIPLPFANLVVLIPVLTSMVASLANLYQVSTSPRKLLMYFAASSGAFVFGQVTLFILLSFVPFGHMIGILVGAPFVYGWTYGLGEVAIIFFQSSGKVSRQEMKEVFRDSSKRASKEYGQEKKVSKQEALDALQEHLPPEDYDRLRNAANTGALPDLDLDYFLAERVLETQVARMLSKAGYAVTLSVTASSPSGEIVIPIVCEVKKRRWAIYIETEPWTDLAIDRLQDWLRSLRASSKKDVSVRVYSPDPVPEDVEPLLWP